MHVLPPASAAVIVPHRSLSSTYAPTYSFVSSHRTLNFVSNRGFGYQSALISLKKITTVNSEMSRGFYFRETSQKPSRNRKITLPFTDVGKSCTIHDFLT